MSHNQSVGIGVCFGIVDGHESMLPNVPVHDSVAERIGNCRGSDVHVMLALHRRSRQVVVAYEILDGADVIGQFLGE